MATTTNVGGGDVKRVPLQTRLLREEALEKLVQRVLAHHRLTLVVLHEHVRMFWPSLVGQMLGRNTEPGQFHRDTMELYAKTSTWMHELQMLKRWIAAQINFGMKRYLVGDIKLRFSSKVGQSDRRAHVSELDADRRARRPPPPRTPTPADPAAAAEILAETSCVEDPELRELIANVRTRWDR